MNTDTVLFMSRQALETALWICGPALLTGLLVGILISIFQVATSIQDPNLALLPRVIAMTAIIFLMLPSILKTMVSYTVQLFQSIPQMIR